MNTLTIDIQALTNNSTLILPSTNMLYQSEAYLQTISSGIRQAKRSGITVGGE
ncbi:hypothetical protein HNE72_003197 [Salmonella enterica]|uniref:Uncharacterized protein n=1 Tax=Salmonella enterica subsp. houtenae serovar 45:g,z51:- TaxID=1967611 RepID=A0A753EK97_SALHO|nr:hypothetical protein [Salmonella enterica]HAF0294839.1 hypothetical protein [Salmonella enterica subsp. houtenae serovar 43:z4,z32:-]EDP8620198.1 hypothetical protein [Salmonella enterica]EDR0910160.1 hypothetical protein [Salmonella enterica]EDS2150827.1 hypothetical protein [Salmonella enterica]EDT0567756.1 hypothetical protein [Salmonella enterica]